MFKNTIDKFQSSLYPEQIVMIQSNLLPPVFRLQAPKEIITRI